MTVAETVNKPELQNDVICAMGQCLTIYQKIEYFLRQTLRARLIAIVDDDWQAAIEKRQSEY